MNNLTINIIVDDKRQFESNNKDTLEKIANFESVTVRVTENDKGKYWAYQELLETTASVYTVFFDEWNVLDVKTIRRLAKDLNKHNEDILTCRVAFQNGDRLKIESTDQDRVLLYFNRYIFKTEALKQVDIFENEYPYFEEKIILATAKAPDETPLMEDVVVVTEMPLERNVNSYARQFEKEWYHPFFENFLLPYMERNQLSESEQRMIVYFIMLRFYLNYNARDKQVIQAEEVDTFFSLVTKAISQIDDQYLIEIRERGMLPKFFSYLMLKEKHKELQFHIEKQADKLLYKVNDLEYATDCVSARIAAINYEADKLIIDGELVGDYCLPNVEDYFAICANEENIPYRKTERYNIAKAFGKSIYRYYAFQFELPIESLNEDVHLQFKILAGEAWEKIPIVFDKVASRLIRSRCSYFTFSDRIITFSNETLHIVQAKKIAVLAREIGMCLKMLKSEKNKKFAMNAVLLRGSYWLTKRKYSKKPVWIFYDKLYKAGDNAEYLFRYCMKNHPEAECYYILTKHANEYSGLKREFGKHIVVFESLQNKLAVLNAKHIFATHATVYGFCGFNPKLRRYFKNLLKADVECIQHGLTIQNIAQYQNRLEDNTKKYFCASKYEIDNLRQPIYGYKEENLCLTGCPRYDGLVNRDVKQILIAPTWRRNIVITGNKMGTAKSYNPDFKNTKYFEIYNSLINDERLIDAVKQYGYKLVFLIHPTLSSQVEDYDTNEFLSIIPAVSDVSYEKMLTESSLMLTDYSGIQFDFAYMKKPILYYHPKELPPQYTEGVYQYETMGFGPIIDEYDQIVEKLCESIKNGCPMDEKYVARVDDFFAYTDHSNCKRIMEEVRDEDTSRLVRRR